MGLLELLRQGLARTETGLMLPPLLGLAGLLVTLLAGLLPPLIGLLLKLLLPRMTRGGLPLTLLLMLLSGVMLLLGLMLGLFLKLDFGLKLLLLNILGGLMLLFLPINVGKFTRFERELKVKKIGEKLSIADLFLPG